MAKSLGIVPKLFSRLNRLYKPLKRLKSFKNRLKWFMKTSNLDV